VFTDAPAVAVPARALARDALIERLLLTFASADDVAALEQAVQDAESALTDLLRRQQRIARELKAMLDGG